MSRRQIAELHPHPASPCPLALTITVAAAWQNEGLTLSWRIAGEIAAIVLPPPAAPEFSEGLWQHTCFEAFVAGDDAPAYREFNFSPSGQWACWAFTDYRCRVPADDFAPPQTRFVADNSALRLEALIPASSLPHATRELRLGLTAVIEKTGSMLGYWALAHPAEQPDFHLRDGFVLALPPFSSFS